MSLAQKAADDIKNFVSRIRPLLDAADALEQIGNVEQLASEAVARKAKADSEYEELRKKIEAQKAERIAHGKEITEARNFAAELVSSAEKKCEEIEDASSRKVSGICNDALKAKKAVEDEISKLKVFKSALLKEIEEKKLRLSEIENELASAKSKIAAFMRA